VRAAGGRRGLCTCTIATLHRPAFRPLCSKSRAPPAGFRCAARTARQLRASDNDGGRVTPPSYLLNVSEEAVMPRKGRANVIGVFADRDAARKAVAELKRVGFRDDQIGLVSPGKEGHDRGTHAAEGAGIGAAAGAG